MGREVGGHAVGELVGKSHFIAHGLLGVEVGLAEERLAHIEVILEIFEEVLVFRILEKVAVGEMDLGPV